ncbi:MAG: DUF2142 domain-containing protein [Lautropia sp.]|nr:DUF2142 domain-containing protein [Lautropia sp.]
MNSNASCGSHAHQRPFPPTTILLVVLSLLIGSLFSVLMPPMKSFDEADHLRRAYMLTRGKIFLMTMPCEGETPLCHNGRRMSGGRIDGGLNEYLVMRHEHAGNARKENHEKQEQARQIRWTGTRTFHEAPGTGYYFPLVYAPQAVGLAAGRMLDLTIEHSYYLARFSSLLFSILALVLAFSMLNASPIMLALLVLPMSLFQAASASLDTFSTALAILATCCFIRGMQDGPATSRRTLQLLGVTVFLVATSRTHLITMLLMPLAVAWRVGHRRAWLGAGLTVATVLVCLAIAIPSTVDFRVMRSASTGEIALHYLGNPAELFAVFSRTLGGPDGLHALLRSFVGHSFGLIFPRHFYDAVFWLLAVLALLSLAGWRQLQQALASRALLLTMGAGSVFLGFLAMLLTFTPHPAHTIDGVQGRYFLVPILLMLLAVCDWQGKPRWLEWLRWSLFSVLLFLSALTSAGYIVDNFYTQNDPDTSRQEMVSPRLSRAHSIALRLASPGTGAPASRIGIKMATRQSRLGGKAEVSFLDDEGRSHRQVLNLGEVADNQYHVFEVPPARYVAGRIVLVDGGGGLSVWEMRQEDDDDATAGRSWLSCATLTSPDGGVLKTPGCR